MIGRLSGVLVYRGRDHIVLDVRGVGYVVQCSERTLAGMPAPGGPVALFTELLVREDLLQLYGFPTLLEKEWHRLLTSVQGVGAKASMSILSTLGVDGVGRAIALGDWGALRKAQGVGPKIAQRVVNELKDKGPEVMAMGGTLEAALDGVIEDGMAASEGIEPPSAARPAVPSAASDQAGALSALVNLGYGQGEAASAVATAAGEGAVGETDIIRAALRLLAPKG
ncbi:holliday junction DNA helicase RuvA [Dinoroseobacter shibae DFL 12 = DSM 16493]|jgi:Holliday junction DNA helicase RuvA|uniref:Holliday junction branch migration complex subunit RuvA n=1 Tax=Dinoroseobacter shibae (strain DSM 16493 / NCIMB 14021 / DFL 12) TaxID=398580 RepID=RUVA_DINSH|nr:MULTISPECIES: Holliday junction branch migration protein RuvA [Dinoroseobacter]A8LHP9.1 RecName: Full=Holliday junction branch migration complex subunit RuvA [Dinoroseobacter shibae DFL 12 = DSM 16493]ABV92846.1 holliday junction DNA helicase RuvA [Dinoroseobacter shibae DFL 12 = DSM 16493]MDD9715946.1 Holliday junction branch migration protein RuvA [Dinoroseobacter sp. PD6]URF47785.1 Holliday junction branch migration protein RuvA [Dinoroseobacter shibae]URF52095.1 Holliday junction branch